MNTIDVDYCLATACDLYYSLEYLGLLDRGFMAPSTIFSIIDFLFCVNFSYTKRFAEIGK